MHVENIRKAMFEHGITVDDLGKDWVRLLRKEVTRRETAKQKLLGQ